MNFEIIKLKHKKQISDYLNTFKNKYNKKKISLILDNKTNTNFNIVYKNKNIISIIGLYNNELFFIFSNPKHISNILKEYFNQLSIVKKLDKINKIKIKVSKTNKNLINFCNQSQNFELLNNKSNKEDINTYLVIYQNYLENSKYNYLVKSNCISDEKINKLFNKSKWTKYKIRTNNKKKRTKKKSKEKSIDYLHIDTKYILDKSLFLKTNLKNIIDTSKILHFTQKNKIFENLLKLKIPKLNKFLPNQKTVNIYNIFKKKVNLVDFKKLFKPNKTYIFKYTYSAAGRNIGIFKNYYEFQLFVDNIIKNNSNRWDKLDYKKYLEYSFNKKSLFNIDWVLQEYISKPLLYKNKKFHFRTYFLFNNINKKYYYLNKSIIATARLNYKDEDYLNKDIHDTHFYRTDKQITFPDNFSNILTKKEIIKVDNQIAYLLKNIGKYLKNKVECYQENKFCYHLFGADLLLDSKLQIKLLELNTNPGCSHILFRKGKYNYPESIFENIIREIVNPHFKIKNQNKENSIIKFIELSS